MVGIMGSGGMREYHGLINEDVEDTHTHTHTPGAVLIYIIFARAIDAKAHVE